MALSVKITNFVSSFADSAPLDKLEESERSILHIIKDLEELSEKFDSRVIYCGELQLHRDYQQRIEMLYEKNRRIKELTTKFESQVVTLLIQENQRKIEELTEKLIGKDF